jgi:RNA polymerase sigma factor (sigma-70 family)
MTDEFYNTNYKKFLKFIKYQYRKIPKSEHEELFLLGCYKYINSKAYQNNEIEDHDSYLWKILLKEPLNYCRKATKEAKCDTLLVEEWGSITEEAEGLKSDFIVLLNDSMKTRLSHIEYQIFFLFANNHMSYKDIAKHLSYSPSTIYQKTKNIYEKIKIEISENRNRYYL